MVYENDVFTADNPAPFDVTERNGKKFRVQRYVYNPVGGWSGGRWFGSGTRLNKDGSLHASGHGSSAPVDTATVPLEIRMRAQAFYDDLADRLLARYRQVALDALDAEVTS